MNISKVSSILHIYPEIKEEENCISEELAKEKSNNSVIILANEKSLKGSNGDKADEQIKKEEIIKEDKKINGEVLERDTKTKDIQLEKKEEQINEQPTINKKKVINNACCNIL